MKIANDSGSISGASSMHRITFCLLSFLSTYFYRNVCLCPDCIVVDYLTHNSTIECSCPATGTRGQYHQTFYGRNLRIFSNKLECLWGRLRALPANRLERLAKEKIQAYYKHLYITAVKSLIVQAPGERKWKNSFR